MLATGVVRQTTLLEASGAWRQGRARRWQRDAIHQQVGDASSASVLAGLSLSDQAASRIEELLPHQCQPRA